MHPTVSRLLKSLARPALAALALATTAPAVSADTLLMPPRDFLKGESEVVWGVSTLPNGTAYTIFYGDGQSDSGTVSDRSYIAFNHTYQTSGPLTVTLQVGAEQATVQVRVFDPATIGSAELRGVNINRAIQNGLRYLWVTQENRAANFPDGTMTNWNGAYGSHNQGATAFIVYAFHNHGYLLPNNNTAPTGLYERFLVQRGLNYIVDNLLGSRYQYVVVGQTCYDANWNEVPAGDPSAVYCYDNYDYVLAPITLGLQQPGDRDPCVGPGIEAVPCQGLLVDDVEGYSTAVAALSLASSGALSRTIPAGLGSRNEGFVGGKTFGEILQRLINTLAWGQQDPNTSGPNGENTCIHAGGWDYGFYDNSCGRSDGSTVGWNVQALLDAAAAGVAEPTWVKELFVQYALANGENTIGTLDYVADGDPGYPDWQNIEKSGILGTAHYYAGVPLGVAVEDYVNSRWNATNDSCGGSGGGRNLGCAYSMYNVFKSFKLHGKAAVPNADSTPGGGLDGDWYGEYENWLVANQLSPTSQTGGAWSYGDYNYSPMAFSCCFDDDGSNTAIALLVLAPVALITPDPAIFAELGLAQRQTESPETFGANPVNIVGLPGEKTHKVIATARSGNNTPIPGVTISIGVLNGPHVNQSFTGTSNAQGQVEFTYTGNKSGLDQIRAFIGQLNSNTPSNVVQANWFIACDINNNGAIDNNDLTLLRARNNQNATGPTDPYDPNRDGRVNVADVRFCQLRIPRP